MDRYSFIANEITVGEGFVKAKGHFFTRTGYTEQTQNVMIPITSISEIIIED
jgi:hypothetical protein